MSTRLAQLAERRFAQREAERAATRTQLRTALAAAGALPAWVFGSLTRAGRFHPDSDVDVALAQLPEGWSLYGLTAWLAEKLGRPVDVVLLTECRFHNVIEREGELWTR